MVRKMILRDSDGDACGVLTINSNGSFGGMESSHPDLMEAAKDYADMGWTGMDVAQRLVGSYGWVEEMS